MVTVIHRGVVPAERIHRVNCLNCKSTLEFKQGEAKLIDDFRNGSYLLIHCPVCAHAVTKSCL